MAMLRKRLRLEGSALVSRSFLGDCSVHAPGKSDGGVGHLHNQIWLTWREILIFSTLCFIIIKFLNFIFLLNYEVLPATPPPSDDSCTTPPLPYPGVLRARSGDAEQASKEHVIRLNKYLPTHIIWGKE